MKKKFGIDFDPDKIFCYGCKPGDKPLKAGMAECPVRTCPAAGGLESCVQCLDPGSPAASRSGRNGRTRSTWPRSCKPAMRASARRGPQARAEVGSDQGASMTKLDPYVHELSKMVLFCRFFFVVLVKAKLSGGIMRHKTLICPSRLRLALFRVWPLHAENASRRIDRVMTSYCRCGQFNGAILVKKGKDIIYAKAFGLADRQWNVKNTLDSKFLIGSISESYTALMVLILAGEGLIDLNATLNAYIPQYDGPGKNRAHDSPDAGRIRPGSRTHGAIPDLAKKRVRWIYDSDQYLELVKEASLKFEPGTGFQYSGIAYNLLAIMCEKYDPYKGFAELLKQRIFAPLHMEDTTLNNNLDIDSKRAFGYHEYHLLEGYKSRLPCHLPDHCKGSGGSCPPSKIWPNSTTSASRPKRTTSRSLYQKMFTPHVKDWQRYGYGWWIDTIASDGEKKTPISHGGSTDGYKGLLDQDCGGPNGYHHLGKRLFQDRCGGQVVLRYLPLTSSTSWRAGTPRRPKGRSPEPSA
ncbi:MAG: serine hydrolase [Candidatus Moduliflexus flocculans]|nr:serine hydrolase [Candidatus Moduliflexus flocculans]